MKLQIPTAFQKQLASTAQHEYDQYNLYRENQTPLSAQIERYWMDLGFKFPGVVTPWSAVFVSWCVKTAGATSDQFRFAEAHSVFVHDAIQNQGSHQGVFRGRRVSEYAPKLGDIVQNNRSGKSLCLRLRR